MNARFNQLTSPAAVRMNTLSRLLRELDTLERQIHCAQEHELMSLKKQQDEIQAEIDTHTWRLESTL